MTGSPGDYKVLQVFFLRADTWECQALREHLLAQVHNTHPGALKVETLQARSSASPHDQNIDPAIAGSGMMSTSAGESGGDENASDGKKSGKRELSTSKRAAQNRQAQVCMVLGFALCVSILDLLLVGGGKQTWCSRPKNLRSAEMGGMAD